MGSVRVSVYGRLKPRPKNSQCQEFKLKYGDHEDQISFTTKGGVKKVYRFKKIFAEDVSQKQVFDVVAKPVIENVFEGYNGTIFTYGQTGSGKTHTMTGSLESWVETGLIPRALKAIFEKKESNTIVTIAYFEIYNEHIYDLIRRDNPTGINFMASNEEESIVNSSLRNLSVHTVTSASQALQLFKRGDTNKMMAETSSNARSSRSHVIFYIALEFPHPKEEMINLKPVLYLVDLAGSERVSKSKIPMANPWETRNINLSLHYLEQVLVALRQPGRAHIPYRNSLMTALLRNSLGGNCITCMIATFSLSVFDIEETMQTCRFSERIALIKNEVKITGLTTPEKEIEALKKENELLKTQLKLLTTQQLQEQLDEKEKEKCFKTVQNFITDNDFFELPLTDIRRMEFCFRMMRDEILNRHFFSVSRPLIEQTVTKKESISDSKSLKSKNVFNVLQSRFLTLEQKIDKSSRRRNLDLPKVNITYNNKGWESLEQSTEKENTVPKKQLTKNKPESNVSMQVQYKSEIPPECQGLVPLHKKPDLDSDIVHQGMINLNKRPNLGCDLLQQGMANFYKKSNLGCDLLQQGMAGFYKKSSLNSDIVEQSQAVQNCNNTNDELTQKRKGSFFFKKFANEMKSESFPYFETSIHSSNITHSKPSQPSKMEAPRHMVDIKPLNKIFSYDDSMQNENHKSKDGVHLRKSFLTNSLPLTGDREVDEEIIKFYQSRHNVFNGK